MQVDQTLRELQSHGTREFAAAAYQDDCTIFRSLYTHWHDDMELVLIDKGRGEFGIGQQSVTVYAGDLAILPPGILHYIKSDNTDILYYRSLVFSPALLSGSADDYCQSALITPLVEQQFQAVPILSPAHPAYAAVRTYLLTAIECCETRPPFYSVRGKGILFLLLYELIRHNCLIQTQEMEQRSVHGIKACLSYIHTHYQDPLSVAIMAKYAHYSQSYFMKVFRQYTGKTLTEYLSTVRIEQACQLLQSSALSVTEIALEVGFGSSSYFIKQFHRAVGMTPRFFRGALDK